MNILNGLSRAVSRICLENKGKQKMSNFIRTSTVYFLKTDKYCRYLNCYISLSLL